MADSKPDDKSPVFDHKGDPVIVGSGAPRAPLDRTTTDRNVRNFLAGTVNINDAPEVSRAILAKAAKRLKKPKP